MQGYGINYFIHRSIEFGYCAINGAVKSRKLNLSCSSLLFSMLEVCNLYSERLVCFAECRMGYIVSGISVRQGVMHARSLRN